MMFATIVLVGFFCLNRAIYYLSPNEYREAQRMADIAIVAITFYKV